MTDIRIIRQTAADWLVEKHGAQWNEKRQTELNHWLSNSSDNLKIYLELETIWAELPHLSSEKYSCNEKTGLNKLLVAFDKFAAYLWVRPAVSLASGMTLLVAISAILFNVVKEPPLPWESYATSLAEVKKLTLEDGSIITLGGKTKINYRLGKKTREIQLIQGQAFFDVASEKARPFFVFSNKLTTRVVGTQFDVRNDVNQSTVTVLEGEVQVTIADPNVDHGSLTDNKQPVVAESLVAGDKLTFNNHNGISQRSHSDTSEIAQWRNNRLVYKNESLLSVVTDLNRYYKGRISVKDKQLGETLVTLAFNVDQLNVVLESLEESLPLKLVSIGENEILLLPTH